MDETFFAALFPKLECIIMERTDSGEYVPRTAAPHWFVDAARTSAGDGPATLGGALPFLDHLRTEADRFWWSGEEGVMTGEPFAIPGADDRLPGTGPGPHPGPAKTPRARAPHRRR